MQYKPVYIKETPTLSLSHAVTLDTLKTQTGRCRPREGKPRDKDVPVRAGLTGSLRSSPMD